MGISKNEFWDTNYYNNPPLTEDMILTAEKTLGVKLPARLIELLQIQNGGYTKGFVFPMTQKTSWSDDHVSLTELFGIVTDPEIESGHNILDTAYMTAEWDLPGKQVLLAGDGHWWITLDYRGRDIPTVQWIDTECDEDLVIANTFDEFLNGLVPEESFEG